MFFTADRAYLLIQASAMKKLVFWPFRASRSHLPTPNDCLAILPTPMESLDLRCFKPNSYGTDSDVLKDIGF